MEKQDRGTTPPQSPEGYPRDVREQLNQQGQTHEGDERPADDSAHQSAQHQGAIEDEVTAIKPPMTGPSNLVGGTGDEEETDDIHPAREITPG